MLKRNVSILVVVILVIAAIIAFLIEGTAFERVLVFEIGAFACILIVLGSVYLNGWSFSFKNRKRTNKKKYYVVYFDEMLERCDKHSTTIKLFRKYDDAKNYLTERTLGLVEELGCGDVIKLKPYDEWGKGSYVTRFDEDKERFFYIEDVELFG